MNVTILPVQMKEINPYQGPRVLISIIETREQLVFLTIACNTIKIYLTF